MILTKYLEFKHCRENFLVQQIMICCRLFTMSHCMIAHNIKNVPDCVIRSVIAAIVSLREIREEIGMMEDQIQEKIYSILLVPETAPRASATDFFSTAIQAVAPLPSVLNSDRAFDSESTMDESGSTPPIPPPSQPIEDCYKFCKFSLRIPLLPSARGRICSISAYYDIKHQCLPQPQCILVRSVEEASKG
jgi:hypothetical protein